MITNCKVSCRDAYLFHKVLMQKICMSSTETTSQVKNTQYAYVNTENDDHMKRNKNLEGSNYVGLVNLPSKLKESLASFYKQHPSRRLTVDGLKLTRHLKNRGRPAHSTWSKYKAQAKGKRQEKVDVRKFSFLEAVNAGLIDSDTVPQENTDTKEEIDQLNKPANENERSTKNMRKPLLAEYSMVRYGLRETQAYVASQLPMVYGTTLRALKEIKGRLPLYKPTTLLDFGSGTGMSVWAAHQLWPAAIKEYQCVEPSENMNEVAEYLLRGSSDYQKALKIPNVYFKRFLPLSNQITYDIVISSHTLTEMPFRTQRMQAIKSLWRKTNDFLVIIEPGNNEGFDITLQARRFITEMSDEDLHIEQEEFHDLFSDLDIDNMQLEDEGHLFAPCPHELTCARTHVETRDHPCNFSQKVELSFSQRNTNLKKHGYFNVPFSFLIIQKGDGGRQDDKSSMARILQPIRTRKRHVICEVCCANGNIENHVLTKKKDPYLYKAVRHRLRWGDMLPLDEAKRPLNVRVPIPPIQDRKKSSK